MRPVTISLTEGILADQAWATEDVSERIEGWSRREAIAPGEGLLIAPCASVHSMGMKLAIDVVFLDPSGRITKVVHGLKPNRVAWGSLGNLLASWRSQALELPEGGARGLKKGDRLRVDPRTP